MRKGTLFFLGAVCFFLGSFILPVKAGAIDCNSDSANASAEVLEQIKNDCEKQIQEKQDQVRSLSQQITLMNDRIKLTSLRVIQTENSIKALEQEIASLSEKIVRLDGSLNYLSRALISRIVETYQVGRQNTIALLLASSNLAEFIARYHYLQAVQYHDRTLLLSMEQTRTSYDEQKALKEEAQIKMAALKKQLDSDKALLNRQKKEKETLLADTQNDQRRYQQLLNRALAEIASFKGFTQKQTGGVLPPQNSPDGWYYSQRDERWAGRTIGYSRETIFDVGCLVADVAMLFTYYGYKTTPADVAVESSYFYLQTAYMRSPWPTPPGKSIYLPGSVSALNQELDQGRPVIVHLKLGGDGHFVVLKKREGDDYLMHDPWEGYDKKFKDYYRISDINTSRMVVYK